MAELGFIAQQGISRVGDLLAVLLGEDDAKLAKLARQALRGLAAELWALGARMEGDQIGDPGLAKENEASKRFVTIPCIGPITALAIVATIADLTQFHSILHFAAFIGLLTKQNRSGGKERHPLRHIPIRGQRYGRRNYGPNPARS
jgi:transposase